MRLAVNTWETPSLTGRSDATGTLFVPRRVLSPFYRQSLGNDGRMSDTKAETDLLVVELQPGTIRFDAVQSLAAEVQSQDRHLTSDFPAAMESHVLGAFSASRCAGFLRYLIQIIGAEEGRPAVMRNGMPLTEGFVEAFGVDPQLRRRGVGTALQQCAAGQCRGAGCYQMRSRSPVTSVENYALKIAAGYVLDPSHENDSYYWLLRL